MATETDTFLHLVRPLAPTNVPTAPTTSTTSTSPLQIHIQPAALLSILDHTLRRPNSQSRVIGTLLGTRTSSTDLDASASSSSAETITICNCYAVPHTETAEQVEVDMDYQKTMLAMHTRVNPKEQLVGWYATEGELNTFSALIQNFYGAAINDLVGGAAGAVHLTVDADIAAGQPPRINTYVSAPIGVTPERAADSCLFIPVPHEIVYNEAEKSGLELLSSAKEREDRAVGITGDIEGLERGIEYVLEMLERVEAYVSSVLDEEAVPSTPLGQFLLNALSLAPKVGGEDVERDFNNHIQDVLVVSYLTNTIRTQIDLSNRLATATLNTIGGGTGPAANDTASVDGGGGAGSQKGAAAGGTRGGRARGQSRSGVE